MAITADYKDASIKSGVMDGVPKRSPCSMLYVEDHPINAMVVRTILRNRRPEVNLVICETGDAAYARLRNDRPDFLLIDLSLPGTDARDLLMAIRAQPGLANIPVAAIIAEHSRDAATRARDCGFCDYLTKPVVVEKLLHALDTAVYRRAEYLS